MLAYNIFRVGDGATYQIDKDMFPCTVSRVYDNGKRIAVRMDRVEFGYDSEGRDCYYFVPDPDAREFKFHLTDDSKFKRTGNVGYLLAGSRQYRGVRG